MSSQVTYRTLRNPKTPELWAFCKGFTAREANAKKRMVFAIRRACVVQRRFRFFKHTYYKTLYTHQLKAAVEEYGMRIAPFFYGLRHQNIRIDRRNLALLAKQEPYSFKALIDQARYFRGELAMDQGLGPIYPESLMSHQNAQNFKERDLASPYYELSEQQKASYKFDGKHIGKGPHPQPSPQPNYERGFYLRQTLGVKYNNITFKQFGRIDVKHSKLPYQFNTMESSRPRKKSESPRRF